MNLILTFRKVAVLCFSLLLIAMIGSLAGAESLEEDSPIFDLEPMKVTGEVYAFGAQKIVLVEEEDLELIQAGDLSDIFSQDPSIQVGGGMAAAQKIYIRGVEDKLLNISIDGATQGGYLSHHHGQYVIEPELLKEVVVEPGAGGAAVGPGALAGSIQLVTKDAYDFLAPNQQSGMLLKSSYLGNAEGYKLVGAAYGRLSDDVAALVSYSYMDAGDYEDGNGETVDYTGHHQSRAFVKLTGDLDRSQRLSFSHEYVTDEGVFRHRPNFAGWFNHPVAPNNPVAMDLERSTSVLDYRNARSNKLDLHGKVFLTDNTIDREGQYKMGYRSLGLLMENSMDFDNHRLNYGIDYRDDSASFTGQGSVSGFAGTLEYATIPDESVKISGLFVQDAWSVSDAVSASMGLRIDRYDYTDYQGQEFKDTGLSPNVGVSYALAKDLNLNASFGMAFRGVTPIDLITANEGSMVNDPDAGAEEARNFEVGFQYDNGLYFLNGTYYDQEIDDVLVDANGDNIRGNEGRLEVSGYDLSAGLHLEQLTASIGVSHSKPEFDGERLVDTDTGLGTSTGRRWNASFRYLLEEAGLLMGWSGNYVEKYEDTPEGSPAKPSYFVHDVFARWSPSGDDRWTLTLTVRNLFDKYYVDQATSGYNSRLDRVAGLPEAGQDIRLSATFKY